MSNAEIIHSSGKDDWATPHPLFNFMNREFQFGLDAAADSRNAKCTNYLGPDHADPARRNALVIENWFDHCEMQLGRVPAIWVNPPYSRAVGKWLAKGKEQSQFGIVVMLVFARTDTKWFQDIVWQSSEIRLIRSRLKFIDPATGKPAQSKDKKTGRMTDQAATAPSAVVVFKPGWDGPPVWRRMQRIDYAWSVTG